MNLKNLVRSVIKENDDIRSNLKKMMNQIGIYHASRSVGGLDNFADILHLDFDNSNSNFFLVKNFIEFSTRYPAIKSVLDEENIQILDVKIETSPSGNKRINILFETDNAAANIESWLVNFYQRELQDFFPLKIRKSYEPAFSIKKGDILLNATKLKYDNLGNIINEENNKNFAIDRLKKMIDSIGIFKTAKAVGGIENLKKYYTNDSDLLRLFNSLKGSLNVIYHSRKEFIEFPMKFEIIGEHKNRFDSNTWPLINLIYDDSNFNEDEKKQFEMFLYNAIADLNIGNVAINPIAKKMFKDQSNYLSADFVNGKYWVDLDHEIEYDDNDIKNLYLKYKQNNKLNESRRLTETKEDPTQKILNFLLRRYKVEERNLGYEDKPIIFWTIFFDVEGETYVISKFDNKREQIRKIVDMLTIHNIIEPIDPYERQLDPYTQKVIRAVKSFLNQVFI
jgi:hypothetical protein